MTAFAQREHFLERPMLLTAPPVGRFAVQNSQRFHYYGELRVNLDSFKANGAEIGFRLAAPAFRVFLALCQCAGSRAPGRARLHARVCVFSGDAFDLTAVREFSGPWPCRPRHAANGLV